MRKMCFIDIETTGLNHWAHSPHQISGIIADLKKDGDALSIIPKEEFNFRCRAFPGQEVDLKALEVSGITMEMLENFPSPVDVHLEFVDLLSHHVDKYNKADKLIFTAYNARFDEDFMRRWFYNAVGPKNYFGSWFFTPNLDVMQLAVRTLLFKRHELPDFKQSTVAQALGIPVDESRLHEAQYDIEIMMNIFRKCLRIPMEGELSDGEKPENEAVAG